MDILSVTISSRNELIKFAKSYLNEESMVWFRDTLNLINKLIHDSAELNVSMYAYNMYNNLQYFFETYCTDLSACKILLALYICAIQFGVRELGDRVESFVQFMEEIDMDDWALLNKVDLDMFDMKMNCYIQTNILHDAGFEVPACGLNTLLSIGFYKQTNKENMNG